ncbi:helix-turn-helix domain-containing protein [Olivibacter sp. XZL3]|uniref:winged helix-turn-helix transcriptional regulator n=1 Tax=Olivibacter sp. XZL3 TaxID=1735116 RepID=UPI00106504CB|nr:helix-turn-helix domain-containing protein [Olivibacter sp. XZL3]
MKNQQILIDTDTPTTSECTTYSSAMDDALYAIGGKWKLRVITALLDGARRFNELQRSIKGISATVLSHELKELELNGFIKRIVYDTTPVQIEYQLTEYSHTLKDVVVALSKWGVMHRETIRKRG